MKSTAGLLASFAGLAVVGMTSVAVAQADNYYAGQAVGGQSVIVDLSSIARASSRSANFVYFLGNERIPSQAHCTGSGSWTTIDDGTVHRSQSQATQNMLNVVCGYLAQINSSGGNSVSQTALVYAPPSNVRATPNGRILCSINAQSYINVYGHSGDWYHTDACGQTGVIHNSQLQF